MNYLRYLQNLEDVVFYSALNDVKNERCIDVGAGRPEVMSVTKLSYDIGRSIIDIESNIECYYELEKQWIRDINYRVVFSKNNSLIDYFKVSSGGLSTSDPNLIEQYREMGLNSTIGKVETKHLDFLIDQSFHTAGIHFFNIDVGGLVFNVLSSLILEECRPWVKYGTKILRLMISLGYGMVIEDGLNRFFLSDKKIVFRGRFRFPPKLNDNSVRNSELALYKDLNNESNIVARLTSKNRFSEPKLKSITELLTNKSQVRLDLEKQLNELKWIEHEQSALGAHVFSKASQKLEKFNLYSQINSLLEENLAIKELAI